MPPRSSLNLTRLGWAVALPVLFLTTVGLFAIDATDRTRDATEPVVQTRTDGDGDVTASAGLKAALQRTTVRQGIYFVTGIALMLITLVPSYQKIGRYAFLIYGIVIFLLLLLVIDRHFDLPMIPVRRNTRRWIEFGGLISIQPSEFMKPALILALARYLRFRSSYRRLPGLIPPFLLTLGPMLLILRQPDLGTLLMLLPVLFAMLFVAGARLRHLALIIVVGAACLPAFYFWGMKDYQRQRIQVVFKQGIDDERWHMDQGYQLRQSKIALGTGGIFGQGFGHGVFIEHELLPEEHNDFIFAIIGHQWGLLGCLLVILAYGVIVLFGTEVSLVTNDPFGRLLAIGVIVMIVAQALLNMCMTIGQAPITGMTLPFVSAGGSSLWANFIALGLLLNVAQRRPMLLSPPPFAHRDDEE